MANKYRKYINIRESNPNLYAKKAWEERRLINRQNWNRTKAKYPDSQL